MIRVSQPNRFYTRDLTSFVLPRLFVTKGIPTSCRQMDGNETPENLKFDSLEERSICGRLLYYELYLWKLDNAPKHVHRFCDPKIDDKLRENLIKWIR